MTARPLVPLALLASTLVVLVPSSSAAVSTTPTAAPAPVPALPAPAGAPVATTPAVPAVPTDLPEVVVGGSGTRYIRNCSFLAAIAEPVPLPRVPATPTTTTPSTRAVPSTPSSTTTTTKPTTAPKAPSARALATFSILARDRTSADALPKDVASALRSRGVDFDAADARLLRQTLSGGKAWVVPVADIRPLQGNGCSPFGLPPIAATLPRVLPPVVTIPRRPTPPASRAATRRRAARARALRRLPRSTRAVPALPTLAPVGAEPVEGVVVVATKNALAGGGGSISDLVRGRAEPAVDPCAGPKRGLVGVSGVVPDGIDAVYLTSPDGTAVRTDVRSNGYTFLVPRTSLRLGQRYVVWTGTTGIPHVQPISGAIGSTRVCRVNAKLAAQAEVLTKKLKRSKAPARRLRIVPQVRITPEGGFPGMRPYVVTAAPVPGLPSRPRPKR